MLALCDPSHDRKVTDKMAEDKKKKQIESEEAQTCENVNAEENAQADASAEDGDREELVKSAQLEKELEQKTKELAELNDRFLRMAAEYDNYKKRTTKEKEDISIIARSDMLKQLLPVFDNIDRASQITDGGEKLVEGVALIKKSFTQTLEKIGIKEIDVLGKEFDPNTSEAIFHVDEEGKPENTVCEVLQKGYEFNGHIVRHALVKVVN